MTTQATELADTSLLRFKRARGVYLQCQAGRLWISHEGDREDTFLDAGEGYLIPGNGLVIAEAIGSTRLSITPRRPAVDWLRRPFPARLLAAVEQIRRHRLQVLWLDRQADRLALPTDRLDHHAPS